MFVDVCRWCLRFDWLLDEGVASRLSCCCTKERHQCGFVCTRSIVKRNDKALVPLVVCLSAHCNSVPLEDHIWSESTGHGDDNNSKKRHCSWWCAACGGQYEWIAPNRILVVQVGTNATEAFKAHAAPQGPCDNLINVLKLLANQQKDGDSPNQCTVTGLNARSRRGIMDRLRRFSQADNHSAVDVGDLTINIDHIEDDRWSPPLVDADWHAFCQAICIRIGGDEWEELYCHYREMSRAAGSGSQKSKSPLGNESSQG